TRTPVAASNEVSSQAGGHNYEATNDVRSDDWVGDTRDRPDEPFRTRQRRGAQPSATHACAGEYGSLRQYPLSGWQAEFSVAARRDGPRYALRLRTGGCRWRGAPWCLRRASAH